MLTRHQSSLLLFFHHIKPHTNMSTPNSQGLPTTLTAISKNIEGLTAVKASMLSVMCKDEHCQCFCLQETHRSQTQARPIIPEMSLVAERPHNKYESALFIRDDLKVKGMSVCEEDDVELITIELCSAIIQSVYNPPNKQFILPQLQQWNKSHVVTCVINLFLIHYPIPNTVQYVLQ